ncbi:MAG: hypothetical protein ACK5OA_08590 [Acidovorax sp.]
MQSRPTQSPLGHKVAMSLCAASLVVIGVSTYLVHLAPLRAIGDERYGALKEACSANPGCKGVRVLWHPRDGYVDKPAVSVLVSIEGDAKARRPAIEAINAAAALGEDPVPVIENRIIRGR